MKKLIFLLCIVFLASACNNNLSSQPEPIKISAPYLVKITTSGGLCQYGLCEAEYVISIAGELEKTYHKLISENKYEKVTETVKINSSDYQLLKTQITNTNFQKIIDSKFTEICPIVYDGSQHLFSFYPTNTEIILDSCKQIIEVEKDPFKLIYQLIFK